jgi:hypothetical protein
MKKSWSGEPRNIVGARVKQARLEQKPPLSQDQLAGKLAAVGITLDRTAISRIESQTRYVMDFELNALAKVLKKEVGWFFGKR